MEPQDETERLKERAYWLAVNNGVSWETLNNLITSESQWNPSARSKTGDYGLVQINLASWPDITKEQALDPDFSLNWAIDRLKEDKAYLWSVCSCISQLRIEGIKLPKYFIEARDFIPNSPPVIGGVAIFKYKKASHVAVIKKFTKNGFIISEANYSPCLTGTREIAWDDPHLKGFWTPLSHPTPSLNASKF